ncbi:MaoC family dehydratase [Gandjariella thermophila]|uniref:Acyl dehydratase n=1 Tax=Gandjariella thermophila TaxID=1931992 RepID=A0A4D4JAK6_9PSEU|nr:MaoC family dehydratase [Gandjariella thermophila]GDY31708.1 acyl dehydratase [Gandjariella thermophila]
MTDHAVDGPYFDDLRVGQVFDQAPAVTLTTGQAAVHQMILGDRLRLPLDEPLSRTVLGDGTAMAHPGLVWDVAIGQSTVVTQRVVANLFYRGLAFHRAPVLGDTLHTRTEVVALRQNRSRPTGLAALRITTTDQQARPVLDFWRCAMLPMRRAGVDTGQHADLDAVGAPPAGAVLAGLAAGFDLDAFRRAVPTGRGVSPGAAWRITGGDVVSSAPELARLTLNLASVHHDAFAGPGGRLVYGGHTVGIAMSQLVRAIPDMVTVAGWHGCDHTGPVREGDTLYGAATVDEVEPLAGGGTLAHLRVRVRARTAGDPRDRDVLDWRPIALLA